VSSVKCLFVVRANVVSTIQIPTA